MNRRQALTWMGVLILVILLTLPYAWQLIKVVFCSGNVLHQLEIFKWVALGAVAFAIVRRYIKGNLKFAETFSHELTHTVCAFCFNMQVSEFHAKQNSGYIMSAGHNAAKSLPLSLAPYCFPLFTFILLAFRWMMDFHGMWLFDIIIGATLCFHICCFKSQIGNYQTDINRYPLLLSYTYIATAWLLVFCIIIPSFFPNMNGHGTMEPMYDYGVFSAIWRLLCSWWSTFASFFHIH